jgi:integrase/recombinase XerD
MTDTTKLGSWVRRFLLEHLVSERNLARNTQRSYRDTLALLVLFIAAKVHKQIDQLNIDHLSPENVQQFLQDLEQTRRCSLTTRNQRLAVIHALARFIGQRGPEHIEWCGQIRAIPFKRAAKTSITYLEKSEIDALLAAPNRNTTQGRRDYALLLFLYNTGARADEGGTAQHRRSQSGTSAPERPFIRTDPRQRQ